MRILQSAFPTPGKRRATGNRRPRKGVGRSPTLSVEAVEILLNESTAYSACREQRVVTFEACPFREMIRNVKRCRAKHGRFVADKVDSTVQFVLENVLTFRNDNINAGQIAMPQYELGKEPISHFRSYEAVGHVW